jgi:hypothetical protein
MTVAAFDPARTLSSFASHGVNFVTVGGFAATAWGADIEMMAVLEICYERSTANHLALARALSELGARARGTKERTDVSVTTIEAHGVLRLDTNAGALDCVSTPQGTRGYSDLIGNAVEFSFGEGLSAQIASLGDLVRIARATDGPIGRATVEILAAVKEEIEKR